MTTIHIILLFLSLYISPIKPEIYNTTQNDLSRQIASLQDILSQKIALLENKMDIRFVATDQKIMNSDLKMTDAFHHLDTKMDLLENKFNNISFWQALIISPSWFVLTSIVIYLFTHFGISNIKLIIIKFLPQSFIDSVVEINAKKVVVIEEKKNN
jgi:hypothetical protein